MDSQTDSPAALANSIREQLRAVADPTRAVAMAAYMKNRFAFFGIPTPTRRYLVKPLITPLGRNPNGEMVLQVAELLWEMHERECQYCGTDLLVRYVHCLDARHEPRLAQLVRSKAWWDTVDLLASRVYGVLVAKYPQLAPRIEACGIDEALWLRRVAILHQLGYRGQTDQERLARILDANLDQTDFFIRKGIGWALRQYAYTDPEWVRDYLKSRGDRLAPLSRREGAKHL